MIKKLMLLVVLLCGVLWGQVSAQTTKEAEALQKVGKSVSSLDYQEIFNTSIEAEGEEQKGILRQSEGVVDLFDRVIGLMVVIVPSIGVLIIIVGAYFIMISNGNDNTLSQGKDIIQYTFIGLGIFFSAYIIVSLILSFLKSTAG